MQYTYKNINQINVIKLINKKKNNKLIKILGKHHEQISVTIPQNTQTTCLQITQY